MCILVASISPLPFKHVRPCFAEDIVMSMVKASTPHHQQHELSYDHYVVIYVEMETLEGMGDNSFNDIT